MTNFWGVFVDETGCEFGAGITADTKAEAWDKAREEYPESRCVQLESPAEFAEREARVQAQAARDLDCDDYDDYGDDYDDDDDDDEDHCGDCDVATVGGVCPLCGW